MFIVGLDFDGTCVVHKYPDIGRPVPGALKWLARWVAAGAKIMLWTMRHDSEKEGPVLTQAVEYLRQAGIELWAVNENPDQWTWTASNKQLANVYVDDSAFGCPLRPAPGGGRPVVDWEVVGPAVLALIQAALPKKE